MADTQTTVTTLDIQLLDESREGTVTIKLDNPKSNVTREQVATAMQPALTKQWFLVTTGKPAMYLGDITVNQSIKTKLGGEDFYVTPAQIQITTTAGQTEETYVNVTGAIIQGYNLNIPAMSGNPDIKVQLENQRLTAHLTITATQTFEFTLQLVILGQIIEVPATVTINS